MIFMTAKLFELTAVRKAVLGVAGLAFAGGVVAGPVAGAFESASTPVTSPVAMATVEKPDMGTLVPHGTQGPQQSVNWNAEQKANAKTIVQTAKKLGMDERAAVVAVATAMQESTLNNLGHLGDRNDHDSQGLFQQRPSSGWGSVEQITDPEYAATAFLKALKQVDGWQEMPLTEAAQKVQVSAFPFHYAKWEKAAAEMVQQYWNS